MAATVQFAFHLERNDIRMHPAFAVDQPTPSNSTVDR